MKYLEKKSKKNLFVFLCTMVLLLSILNVATASVLEQNQEDALNKVGNIDTKENVDSDEQLTDYSIEEVHGPIKIDNDTDFDEQADEEGWPGRGLETDPYIISGYEIDGEGIENSVYIANTTVYFDLEGNHIFNSSVNGVYLHNLTNGLVLNNTIYENGDYGISIDQSSDNVFRNNTAFENTLHGIYLSDSHENMISDNHAYNNTHGVGLELSNFNTISNNTLENNSMYGIEVEESNNNMLENNRLENNDAHGVRLVDSVINILKNNTMVECGIDVWGASLEYWNTHFIDDSNTVNGKPLYYWNNETTGTIPSGAGQVILANSTGITVENQVLNNASTGVSLGFSDNNTVRNNNASNNYIGIRVVNSENNTVENNIALNNAPSGGIWVERSVDNIFKDNVLKNNGWYGMMVRDSSHGNTLDGNTMIANNDLGVSVSYSNNNLLVNNTIKQNMWGIQHEGANSNTIRNNIAFNNSGAGVHILGGSENTIENNQVSRNMWGISSWIGGSHHIANNTVWNNSQYNFNLYMSDSNMIKNNTADEGPTSVRVYNSGGNVLANNIMMDNEYGFYLNYASSTVVENNTFVGNDYGIGLSGASSNMIKNNVLEYNDIHAIEISSSSSNTLVGNEMIGNGIFIQGGSESYWTSQSIDTSNTVNGDPVYYWTDKVGGTVPSDAGQVILANATDVTVEGLVLNDGSTAILLGFSDENNIEINNVENNVYGLYLYNSDRNILSGNTFLYNEEGTYLTGSTDNLIYRNRFIENYNQAYDDGDNDWDSGDPDTGGEGGNYWSDYTGTDRGDGIGDVPYSVNGDGNQDNYPWVNYHMVPWADSFVVNVDDVSSGTNPVVEISDAYDMYDELINGVYTLEIMIDGYEVEENLTFTDGYAEYTWPEVMVDGDYTAKATMDGITELDDFYVDTVTPTVEIISPADGSEFKTESVTISWSGSDAVSGIDHYMIRLNDGDWINVGTAQTYTFAGLNVSNYEFEVRGYDKVGHTSTDNSTFEIIQNNYLSEDEVQGLIEAELQEYLTEENVSSMIDNRLQDYLTEQDIRNMIDDELQSSLSAYLTDKEINSLVNESLDDQESEFTSMLNDELQNYATDSDVRLEIQDMLTGYLKEEELDNYMTEEKVESMQSSQDDDISMSRNIGILGVILALFALLIAAWAVMKSGSKEKTYSEPEEQETEEMFKEEPDEMEDPFDEEVEE